MARRRRAAAGVTDEAAWQLRVEQAARLYGWRIYHTHDSRRSAAGFPDLVAVRGTELIFAELKPEEGSRRTTLERADRRRIPELRALDLADEQAAWLEALAAVASAVELAVARAGAVASPAVVDVYLWRPSDWDEVNERLARGRTRLEAVS